MLNLEKSKIFQEMYHSITLCLMNKSIKNDFVFISSNIFMTSNRIVCMRKVFFLLFRKWKEPEAWVAYI